MATQEDRSLSSGMSLPQWMKTKMSDRSDFEQNAFSPTELDDSYMLYYGKNKRGLIKEAVPEKKVDFSKHTPYCQKFLHKSSETLNIQDSTTAQKVIFPSISKTKSSGIDDGFKGEAALCGSSVIRVAHQMVSGKAIRGFAPQTEPDCDLPPEGFNPSLRRGSKSLPASPLSSPKSGRKINKYFTGPYVDTEHHGNWILSNLLAKRKDLSQSVGHIAEEEAEMKKGSSTASVDDLGTKKGPNLLPKAVPKASELREMNFWSPTSM